MRSNVSAKQKVWEYNFDGLAGPSHNFAGLALGNTASLRNKNQISNPRLAALEGLEKMKFLLDRGFRQAVLPPLERPDLAFLKSLGFSGSRERILRSAKSFDPSLLYACWSASNMWTANSAVFSPSFDTEDKKAHFTPANLPSCLHRSLETPHTARILKRIFPDPHLFVHHPPLPALPAFADEGAANHSRIASDYGAPGLELFVYGREGFSGASQRPGPRHTARQSQTASKWIAEKHKLKTALLAKQNPRAISAGVFHNDVIFTADQNLVFCHETAFEDTEKILNRIEQKLSPAPLIKVVVQENEISLKEAVSSYIFNSQLLPLQKDKWLLLAPDECRKTQAVRDYLDSLITSEGPITEASFVSTRQSMKNGGGPACLRLRVALSENEARAVHQGALLTPSLYQKLKIWVEKHYRDRLQPEDLLDPLLPREIQTALDELSEMLNLKGIYPFQNSLQT